tara:strand:- start:1117 stop:1941 length:825 start_codon:yes stop_codon:yes gene_type:complete
MLIGAHIKKEKTLKKTIDNLKKIKGNALQFFTNNPKICKPANLEKYLLEKDEILNNYSDIGLVIHSTYTINISRFEHNTENGKKIFETLITDLIIANELNAIGVVVHVGKSVELNKDIALQNMLNCILAIIEGINKFKLKSKLILETAAGQGSELLVDIDELINFYNQIENKNNIALCFDTCHVYSAGFDLINAYNKIQEKTNNSIILIHLNGSKTKQGSRVDRHENLSKGFIEIDIIKDFIKNINKEIMIILETPDENLIKEEINLIKENINL